MKRPTRSPRSSRKATLNESAWVALYVESIVTLARKSFAALVAHATFPRNSTQHACRKFVTRLLATPVANESQEHGRGLNGGGDATAVEPRSRRVSRDSTAGNPRTCSVFANFVALMRARRLSLDTKQSQCIRVTQCATTYDFAASNSWTSEHC
jgi:hypothetical protein